jgi:hypothetical protein
MIRLPILLLSLLFFISACNGQTHVVEIREKKIQTINIKTLRMMEKKYGV